MPQVPQFGIPWVLTPWRYEARLSGQLTHILDHPLIKRLEGRWHYRPDPPLFETGTFKCDDPNILRRLQSDFPIRTGDAQPPTDTAAG